MMSHELKDTQPIAYRILQNAIHHKTIAHAYLFTGEKGTPRKESAYLLAQSLVCEHLDEDGFACEMCEECLRVMHGNYADLMYVDGQNVSIKKNDILKIQENFSKTRLERRGKKIYILDGVENATGEAMNSLLKFLEEPTDDTMAILICESEDRVMETIVSRCQNVPFYKNNIQELESELLNEMGNVEAHILSRISTNQTQALSIFESDEFQHALYLFETFLKEYNDRSIHAKVFLQNEGFSKSKRDDKEVFSLFLKMLNILCRDIYCLSSEEIKGIWGKSGEIVLKLDVDKIMKISIEFKDKIIRSVNVLLLVDQFLYQWEV